MDLAIRKLNSIILTNCNLNKCDSLRLPHFCPCDNLDNIGLNSRMDLAIRKFDSIILKKINLNECHLLRLKIVKIMDYKKTSLFYKINSLFLVHF